MNCINQLSYIQLAINAVTGNSTGSSQFTIIYGQNIHLLPAVRIYSTNVPSSNELSLSLIKVQQEALKVLELT
jgi:hypothetical protein